MPGEVRVGISGWTYPSWRGDFYPRGLPHRLELAYAAERLTSVEINGSFYSLQRPISYLRWREQTPAGFEFAVKGGRFITHLRRLAGVETALANFFASGVLALGDKLGPILWQLPARMRFDAGLLADFFDLLPRWTTEAAALAARHDEKVPADRALVTTALRRRLRHALEARHESFVGREAAELLREHDIGTVLADSAGHWPVIDDDTSDFRYVRLHGDAELYASGYSGEALDRWTRRCLGWREEGRDVFVYFDNDARGHAPHDAVELLRRVDTATGQRSRRPQP